MFPGLQIAQRVRFGGCHDLRWGVDQILLLEEAVRTAALERVADVWSASGR
jgi:hypothetical protein